MADKSKKPTKKEAELQARIDELTLDVQRTRADFENYRKRVELEKTQARIAGEASAILKLLPVIDNIERAITHAPKDISEHQWVQGVVGVIKQLDKSLSNMNLKRIPAKKGATFNPNIHEAIQFDEDAQGENEVIDQELQAGYELNGMVIRPAMVKVTRKK